MRRITYVFMSTLTALVLLFGYRTSTSSQLAGSSVPGIVAPVQGGTANPSSGTGQTSTGAGSPPAKAKGSTASATPSSPTAGTKATSPKPAVTSTGAAANTQYGPVQVQLVVQGKKITHVSVIEYPNGDPRDREINATALPILINETLTKQTATIDMVSGATYTSEGYLYSLQSALDKAGL